jgi:hypothetical protein
MYEVPVVEETRVVNCAARSSRSCHIMVSGEERNDVLAPDTISANRNVPVG